MQALGTRQVAPPESLQVHLAAPVWAAYVSTQRDFLWSILTIKESSCDMVSGALYSLLRAVLGAMQSGVKVGGCAVLLSARSWPLCACFTYRGCLWVPSDLYTGSKSVGTRTLNVI